MYGYIYKTTCLITKLIYIGQHKSEKFEPTRYIGSGRRFKKAIQEFGKENFICELIDTAESLDELNSKEEYWVEFYQSRDPLIGYNVKKGGEQLGLTGCCKIKKGEETMVVEKASVKPYLDDGWVLTNTKEFLAPKWKEKAHKYYLEHKEQILARGKAWREAHKDRVKELQSNWAKKHTENYNKDSHNKAAKSYYERHKEACKEKVKQYREKNKEKLKEYYKQRYLAQKEKYIERAKQSRIRKKNKK